MMNTKKLFNDQKKRIAFHGTQSFKPGEVDVDTAHEIGIQLINVSTHLITPRKFQVL